VSASSSYVQMVEASRLARRGSYSIGVHRIPVDHLARILSHRSRCTESEKVQYWRKVKLVLERPPGRSLAGSGNAQKRVVELQSRSVARATARIEVMEGSLCAVVLVAVAGLLAQD